VEGPLCCDSTLWEGIRRDDLFVIGSGGTGGTAEAACGKAGRVLVVLELIGRRALISPGGLLEG
jgi:hypothetical protein